MINTDLEREWLQEKGYLEAEKEFLEHQLLEGEIKKPAKIILLTPIKNDRDKVNSDSVQRADK